MRICLPYTWLGARLCHLQLWWKKCNVNHQNLWSTANWFWSFILIMSAFKADFLINQENASNIRNFIASFFWIDFGFLFVCSKKKWPRNPGKKQICISPINFRIFKRRNVWHWSYLTKHLRKSKSANNIKMPEEQSLTLMEFYHGILAKTEDWR